MKKICSVFLIIAFVSFLGFIIENIWLSLTKGYMDNRNMIFPFLYGYGLAVEAIYLAFGTPEKFYIFGNEINIQDKRLKTVLYFLIVMVCISAGEIILGKSVEKICHVKWWDYSWLPLHITQYTSVFTSMFFSAIIVIFMDKAFIPLYEWHLTWDTQTLKIISVTLMAIMTVDFLNSARLMYNKKSVLQIWKLDFTGSRVYKKIQETLAKHKGM